MYSQRHRVLMTGFLVALSCLGCQSKSESGSKNKSEVLQTTMQRDLRRICDGEKLSGALELPLGDRAMHTAIWLASNIESQEARDLSASLRALDVSGRIEKLKGELNIHGLSDCDIVLRWQEFSGKHSDSE